MRTTLNIASDVPHAAKERARREKKTVGQVISDLARSALARAPDTGLPTARCGFRPFPKRGGIVTNELIDRLRAETSTDRALLDAQGTPPWLTFSAGDLEGRLDHGASPSKHVDTQR